jgi:hypothetical protein
MVLEGKTMACLNRVGNRRRFLLATLPVGLAAYFLTTSVYPNEKDKPMTLREKIERLESSEELRRLIKDDKVIKSHILGLMSEHFTLGMNYQKFSQILKENDLSEDEKYFNTSSYGHKYDKSIVSNIIFRSLIGSILGITLDYRLIFEFNNDILERMSASRVGTGP